MNYEEFKKEWLEENNFIKVKTSGSTGKPKEIRLSKDFMRDSAKRTNGFFDIKKGDILYSCISPEFIGGKMMLVRAMLAKAELISEEPSNRPLENFKRINFLDPGKEDFNCINNNHLFLEDHYSDKKIKLLSVVPSQLLFIIENKYSLPKIENILVGGGKIEKGLKEKILRSGLNVYESYGMTETASHIALRYVSNNEEWFKTLGNITVCTDNRGCLVVNIPGEQSIVTNDLGEVKDEKTFNLIGRIDTIINSGGRKINPELIEERIAEIIESPFIITSVPDEKWGEKLILKIEVANRGIDTKEILNKIREKVRPFEVPKDIKIVEKLERTDNGKIKRK